MQVLATLFFYKYNNYGKIISTKEEILKYQSIILKADEEWPLVLIKYTEEYTKKQKNSIPRLCGVNTAAKHLKGLKDIVLSLAPVLKLFVAVIKEFIIIP